MTPGRDVIWTTDALLELRHGQFGGRTRRQRTTQLFLTAAQQEIRSAISEPAVKSARRPKEAGHGTVAAPGRQRSQVLFRPLFRCCNGIQNGAIVSYLLTLMRLGRRSKPMRLTLSIQSESESAVEELLGELPAEGILALSLDHAVPAEGMKSSGAPNGIIVDLLPSAVEGLFKTIAAFFQRPRPGPVTLSLDTPGGKLNLSFDPAQVDAASVAALVEQVLRALRAQVAPTGHGD